MFLSLGRISGIIVAGSSVDILTRDLRIKQLPNVPDRSHGSSTVAHNRTILLCGGIGNDQKFGLDELMTFGVL